jgi:hypothetical protein
MPAVAMPAKWGFGFWHSVGKDSSGFPGKNPGETVARQGRTGIEKAH